MSASSIISVSVYFADDGGDLRQPRPVRGAEAALTGDELVVVRAELPHDDWLKDAARLDRVGQLPEGVVVETLPGWNGFAPMSRSSTSSTPAFVAGASATVLLAVHCLCRGRSGDQRLQSAPKNLFTHAP